MKFKKSETYARVLFEEDSSPEFFQLFKAYTQLFTESAHVFEFFSSPHLKLGEKQQVLDQALKQAPALLKNFFTVLLKNKAFSLLPDIKENYQKLWNDKNKTCTALVFRSQALTEEEKTNLKSQLENFFNKKIVLQEKEDKSLIAGLKIDVEGYMFQASTSHFLKKFEKSGGF